MFVWILMDRIRAMLASNPAYALNVLSRMHLAGQLLRVDGVYHLPSTDPDQAGTGDMPDADNNAESITWLVDLFTPSTAVSHAMEVTAKKAG